MLSGIFFHIRYAVRCKVKWKQIEMPSISIWCMIWHGIVNKIQLQVHHGYIWLQVATPNQHINTLALFIIRKILKNQHSTSTMKRLMPEHDENKVFVVRCGWHRTTQHATAEIFKIPVAVFVFMFDCEWDVNNIHRIGWNRKFSIESLSLLMVLRRMDGEDVWIATCTQSGDARSVCDSRLWHTNHRDRVNL